ncbi:MAG: ankyrin repeat domain-containing protein [Anaerolineaceae bacterium]|nr:ankyrin repeat domain-containing protein [Anaerolineaceae bacterium]
MERPPALEPALVSEFVRVAHGDLDAVTALLNREPGLLNAAWDWGGGDWETGLGAAAHTGSRSIALHLLGAGARIDLFTAAMLGHLETVKAILTATPAARHSTGAHGIPLIVHARAGGDIAAPVVVYLESLDVDDGAG